METNYGINCAKNASDPERETELMYLTNRLSVLVDNVWSAKAVITEATIRIAGSLRKPPPENIENKQVDSMDYIQRHSSLLDSLERALIGINAELEVLQKVI